LAGNFNGYPALVSRCGALIVGTSVPVVAEDELARWRAEIVEYRLLISEDMAPEIARAYWAIIDVIEACIKMSGVSYEAQLELIDREIEERLTRRRYGLLGGRLRNLRALQPLPKQSTNKLG
jgi:hypothetical protein